MLLVGDSDVGKQEILQDLEDGSADSPFCSGSGMKFCKLQSILSRSLYKLFKFFILSIYTYKYDSVFSI